MTSKKNASYYDRVKLENEFDFSKAKHVKTQSKRVNMILPVNLYKEAEALGTLTGTGYQNTLKTAVAIGLKALRREIQG